MGQSKKNCFCVCTNLCCIFLFSRVILTLKNLIYFTKYEWIVCFSFAIEKIKSLFLVLKSKKLNFHVRSKVARRNTIDSNKCVDKIRIIPSEFFLVKAIGFDFDFFSHVSVIVWRFWLIWRKKTKNTNEKYRSTKQTPTQKNFKRSTK